MTSLERERKRIEPIDMEIYYDGIRSVAIDYSPQYTQSQLSSKDPLVLHLKYEPYEVRDAAQNLKNNKYTRPYKSVTAERTKIMNSFPWLQSHLVGLGGQLSSSLPK